jgi:putative DNA primase/helicase
MTVLALALIYALRWPVFPTRLIPRADGTFNKVPLVRWAKDPVDRAAVDARDPKLIEKWWRRWPDAVISMPTGTRSDVIVLDIDVKLGKNGFDTLADFGKSILPVTPIAHTPTGGVHLYFSCNPVEIRNSVGVKGLGLGLDMRGDGGQVVLPGPGGYWWDQHCNFDTVAPMVAPAWLGYRPPKPVISSGRGRGLDPHKILETACNDIRNAAAGERHDVLNREAFLIGGLVADGALSRSSALHQLEAATLGMVTRTKGEKQKAARDLADAFADGLRSSRRSRR